MSRKNIVSIIAAVAILLLAIAGMKWMQSMKKNPKRVDNKQTKTVRVAPYQPSENSFKLPVYGRLTALKKSELYSEVNGILLPTSNQFLEGVSFKKGQTLLHIDDTEARANLMSEKSNFLNAVSKVLPDLKLDFPDEYEHWRVYLEEMDLNKPTAQIPVASDKKAELFLTSQGVYSAYYNLKTSEARLAKYMVRAPYNGVVTESNIKPGTLVRSGQKMGEFVGLGSYELEVYVSTRYLDFIAVGNSVDLSSPEGTQSWTGTISRINYRIDSQTQTVGVFILVNGNDLRDGMYLNGQLSGIHLANSMKIPRKLVFDNNHVFTVINDTTLEKSQVEVIEFVEEEAIIRGLKSNDVLVMQTIAGAYPGMTVSTQKASEE
ncbi:MAG: HlyD family efflux transporter periplasmic adaptor subunit [Schleiferiaceae bacterium]|nr:HlyD family efflux transporter periplasmic adaptor subunit [Schleiferiaceae bacterium]